MRILKVTINTLKEAEKVFDYLAFPVIITPAYCVAADPIVVETVDEFADVLLKMLKASPIHQVLVEKYISEFEDVE